MLQLDPTERECSDEVRSNSEVRDSRERIPLLTTSKILGSNRDKSKKPDLPILLLPIQQKLSPIRRIHEVLI